MNCQDQTIFAATEKGKKMNLKDKETVQRALGIIEGVVCGVSKEAAEMLYTAVEMIDVAVFKEETK